ncbi:hypothetical protein BKK79_38225 (plasmid) [Cupriavidus sp. USMAA2-4]|uniref:bactofilin family protein n=1 Tax=unclassified Cupriavidus TaxID=2640874 RepID=UPI0008A704AD|nr:MULTISPECIES: polymer-forming cytoskeletal protein [unclassified Cupriavidus]AOY97757.1 hypothetical protein BKK79_38225 [Cupriavidus sp. USMAA2-4]AOZ04207.1 hypothetical protein BKK81_32950 [Cupriavidus sp. USMAHM13]
MKQGLTFSVINQGMSIHGNVAADHGISCLGYVEGDVESMNGLVHIGPASIVRGRVEGEHVIVDGTVEGDVAARASLQINGRVKGEIYYAGSLRLGATASLDGRVTRVAALQQPAAPGASAPTPAADVSSVSA